MLYLPRLNLETSFAVLNLLKVDVVYDSCNNNFTQQWCKMMALTFEKKKKLKKALNRRERLQAILFKKHSMRFLFESLTCDHAGHYT